MGAWGVPVLSCFSDFVSEVSVNDFLFSEVRNATGTGFFLFRQSNPNHLGDISQTAA